MIVFLIFVLPACSSFMSPAMTFVCFGFGASNTLQKFHFLPLNITVIVILWSVLVLLISMCEVLLFLPVLLFLWSPMYVFFLSKSFIFLSCTSYYLWPVLITIYRNSLSKNKIYFLQREYSLLLSWASLRTNLMNITGSAQPRWIRLTCLQHSFIPSQSQSGTCRSWPTVN